MKIFKLKRISEWNYDDFYSCIVCAENEDDAKTITPEGEIFKENENRFNAWVKTIDDIKCTEIGTANNNQQRGVILASFNAG